MTSLVRSTSHHQQNGNQKDNGVVPQDVTQMHDILDTAHADLKDTQKDWSQLVVGGFDNEPRTAKTAGLLICDPPGRHRKPGSVGFEVLLCQNPKTKKWGDFLVKVMESESPREALARLCAGAVPEFLGFYHNQSAKHVTYFVAMGDAPLVTGAMDGTQFLDLCKNLEPCFRNGMGGSGSLEPRLSRTRDIITAYRSRDRMCSNIVIPDGMTLTEFEAGRKESIARLNNCIDGRVQIDRDEASRVLQQQQERDEAQQLLEQQQAEENRAAMIKSLPKPRSAAEVVDHEGVRRICRHNIKGHVCHQGSCLDAHSGKELECFRCHNGSTCQRITVHNGKALNKEGEKICWCMHVGLETDDQRFYRIRSVFNKFTPEKSPGREVRSQGGQGPRTRVDVNLFAALN